MKRLTIIGAILIVISIYGFGMAQSSSQDQSLADLARKLKEKQGQNTTPPKGKVFTNDDVATTRPSGGATAETSSTKQGKADSDSAGAHGEKYYRKAYAKLLGKKEMDQRELEVLQKKMNQNSVQYYSDPNQGLKQQYTREDITKNQQELDKKQVEVAADDQAISDLQDQLRRDGGDPGWLQGVTPSIEPDVIEVKPPADDSGGKKKTKEYWQASFKSARVTVAKAEEAQKLVEDEINFLKIRQAQEPSLDAQKEINDKLAEKQPELDTATATTNKAKKILADLQKAFEESGAPVDWSDTE